MLKYSSMLLVMLVAGFKAFATSPSAPYKPASKKEANGGSTAPNSPVLQKKEKRQVHAHSHGDSKLNIIASGKELAISGALPMMDIAGFERPPKTNLEKETLEKALNAVRAGQLLAPKSDNCQVVKSEAEIDPPFPAEQLGQAGKEASKAQSKAQSKAASKEAHYELDLNLVWVCNAEVSKLSVGAFETFPGINRITFQFMNQTKQGDITIQRSDKKTEIQLQ